MSCLLKKIEHALFSSDTRHCPTVKSRSVCSDSNCLFCPTVVRQCPIVDRGLYQRPWRSRLSLLLPLLSMTLVVLETLHCAICGCVRDTLVVSETLHCAISGCVRDTLIVSETLHRAICGCVRDTLVVSETLHCAISSCVRDTLAVSETTPCYLWLCQRHSGCVRDTTLHSLWLCQRQSGCVRDTLVVPETLHCTLCVSVSETLHCTLSVAVSETLWLCQRHYTALSLVVPDTVPCPISCCVGG